MKEQTPYDITITPDLSILTFVGRNGSPVTFSITNNDSRDCPEVRLNVLRADFMPAGTMNETAYVKAGAGETVITDKWVQAKLSTDVVYTPIDHWSSPLAFALNSGATKSFLVKLVIPDDIDVQGKISFSLMISFRAAVEPKVTGISIDNAEPIEATMGEFTTLTATVTADVGADTTVTWSGSDDSIFTIDSSTGIVTPVATGTGIVKAISSMPTIFNSKYLTVIPEPTPPLDGLVAWYDAADLTTITESGGVVSQWDDKSGNDYHATSVSSPSTGLETLNSRNVISFNSNYMNVPAAVLPTGNSPYTILAVWKPNGTDQSLLFWGEGAYNQCLAIQANVGGITINHNWLKSPDLDSAAGTITGATNTLISYDYTTRRTVSDGVEVSDTPGFHTMAATPYFGIGGNNPYGYEITNGYIATIIVYHKILSTADEAALQSFINTKWGV